MANREHLGDAEVKRDPSARRSPGGRRSLNPPRSQAPHLHRLGCPRPRNAARGVRPSRCRHPSAMSASSEPRAGRFEHVREPDALVGSRRAGLWRGSRAHGSTDAARARPVHRHPSRTLPSPQHPGRSGLRDADEVARGVAERTVAHSPGLRRRLLEHLGPRRANLLEGGIEVVGTEDRSL